MDPTALASSAASLVVSYLTRVGTRWATKIEDQLDAVAMTKLERLYKRLKARMKGHQLVGQALERLEQQPENAAHPAKLVSVLTEMVRADIAFAEALTRLVQEARIAQTDLAQVTNGGVVSLGGDVTISGTNVAGRDLSIGDRTQPPVTGG